MKLITKSLLAIPFILIFGVSSAIADPAVVIKNDGECGMVGSDPSGAQIFGGIGRVETNVTNGNKVMIVCKADNITNLSGRGQHYNDFGCGVIDANNSYYYTTDSIATVAPNGKATLKCTYSLK